MYNLFKRIRGKFMKCKYDKKFKDWKDVPMTPHQKEWCKRHLNNDNKMAWSDPSFTHGITVDFSLPKKKRLRSVTIDRCPGCDYDSNDKIISLIVSRDVFGDLVGIHREDSLVEEADK